MNRVGPRGHRKGIAAARARRRDVLPVGAAADRQDHPAARALSERAARALDRSAQGGRVPPLHDESRAAAGRDGSGRLAAGRCGRAWTGGDRRGAESAGAARRSALADRKPWAELRAVRFERPQGSARRRQLAGRTRVAVRVARSDGGRAGRRLRLDPHAEPRLPAADARSPQSRPPPGRLRRQLPEGGDRRRGAGAQPAGVLRLPARRGAVRRRDGELLERRHGLRGLQPHGAGVLRDSGRHAARPLAAGLSPTPEAAHPARAEVLFRGRGHRQPAGAARRSCAGIRCLRQGVRELGVPRTHRLHRLP